MLRETLSLVGSLDVVVTAGVAAITEPGIGNEIQLTDAIQRMLEAGAKGIGVRLEPNEQRYDIGNFDSYFRAFVDFALSDEKHGAALRKHLKSLPELSPNA